MNIVRDTQVSAREIAIFFVVTLGLSIAYVLLSGPMVEAGVGFDQARVWYREKAMVMLWAPMLFALLFAFVFRKKEGLLQLLKRLTIWRVGLKWWLIALILPVVILHLSGVLSRGIVEGSAMSLLTAWLGTFLFLFVIIIGEEMGWRGYALPAMQARMSPFAASLLLGVLWGVWHYPVWFGLNYGMHGEVSTALVFMLAGTINTVGLSFILTWLANGTQASILLAMAYHAANNASLGLLEPSGHYSSFAVVFVVAIVIVTINREMFFAGSNM